MKELGPRTTFVGAALAATLGALSAFAAEGLNDRDRERILAEVTAAEAAVVAASNAGDRQAEYDLMAEDWVYIDAGGKRITKQQMIERRSEDERTAQVTASELEVIPISADAAVTRGRWDTRAVYYGGLPRVSASRYMALWRKRDGRWVLVADQGTPIVERQTLVRERVPLEAEELSRFAGSYVLELDPPLAIEIGTVDDGLLLRIPGHLDEGLRFVPEGPSSFFATERPWELSFEVDAGDVKLTTWGQETRGRRTASGLVLDRATIDVRTGELHQEGSIWIDDDRIVRVAPAGEPVPAGIERVDAVKVEAMLNAARDRAAAELVAARSKAIGLAEARRFAEAEPALRRALDAGPDWAEGWLYLGRVLAYQGSFSAAADAAQRGAELGGARRTSAWLEVASMAEAAGERERALEMLERALGGPVYRRWLVRERNDLGDGAVVDGYLALGDLLDTPQARRLLAAAAERRPSLHPDLLAIERRLRRLERTVPQEPATKRAEMTRYRKLVAELPEDGELQFRLGVLEVQEAGDLIAAIPPLRRAVELSHLVPAAHGFLAYAHAHTGNLDAAFEHLERNLEAFDTPGWIFNPGELEPLHDDPRWHALVELYRVTSAPEVGPPVGPPAGKPQPWPTEEWPRATPEEVDLDAEVLRAAAAEIERAYDHVTSLLVVRHGRLAFEEYFRGYGPEDAQNIKSMTKRAITANLVGIARDRGLLPDLDTPMAEILPQAFVDVEDPRKLDITLRHVLTMTAGFDYEENSAASFEWDRNDFSAEWGLGLPLAHPPGEVYNYSSILSHLLALVVTEAVGTDLLSFAREHLFEPLGIEPESWVRDPLGYYWGFSGLRLRPSDSAKLGLLMLRGGAWEDRQVVSTEWVRESTAIHATRSPQEAFGYQWAVRNIWGYRMILAAGHGGQLIAVVPALDLVAVVTSESIRPEIEAYEILGRWIVPAAPTTKKKRP